MSVTILKTQVLDKIQIEGLKQWTKNLGISAEIKNIHPKHIWWELKNITDEDLSVFRIKWQKPNL